MASTLSPRYLFNIVFLGECIHTKHSTQDNDRNVLSDLVMKRLHYKSQKCYTIGGMDEQRGVPEDTRLHGLTHQGCCDREDGTRASG